MYNTWLTRGPQFHQRAVELYDSSHLVGPDGRRPLFIAMEQPDTPFPKSLDRYYQDLKDYLSNAISEGAKDIQQKIESYIKVKASWEILTVEQQLIPAQTRVTFQNGLTNSSVYVPGGYRFSIRARFFQLVNSRPLYLVIYWEEYSTLAEDSSGCGLGALLDRRKDVRQL